jgi:hypothetical protein
MAARKKSNKAKKSTSASRQKPKSAKRAPKKQASTKLIAKKKGGASSRKKKGTGQRSLPKVTRVYDHKEGVTFEPESAESRSAGQSGDLQGLRDAEDVDSESVDELLEEGNAFEADVVAGVEHADDDEEREVHTHEVPEDDVPEEYEDKD